ncbi:MAG: hypothetical protein CM15mV5_0290 [uncultured marine virus]|nr:MAG: hypothetical protein CM15mV5_0290 [uncultured marine virus]
MGGNQLDAITGWSQLPKLEYVSISTQNDGGDIDDGKTLGLIYLTLVLVHLLLEILDLMVIF